MIWTLRVECVEGLYLQSECVRVIEVEPEASLFELRSAILKAVDFDTDHLYEFRAGRSPRNRVTTGTSKSEKAGRNPTSRIPEQGIHA